MKTPKSKVDEMSKHLRKVLDIQEKILTVAAKKKLTKMNPNWKQKRPTCPKCGAVRGLWHHEGCRYRLGSLPADEYICQYIGDKKEHEKCFKRWSAIVLNELMDNPGCVGKATCKYRLGKKLERLTFAIGNGVTISHMIKAVEELESKAEVIEVTIVPIQPRK